MRDRLRVRANILFAALQIGVPALGYAGVLGRMQGAQFQTAKTPLVPAGYAFAIWGPIYLGLAIYAFEQARPSLRSEPGLRRIGALSAAAMAANAVWSALAQLEAPLWVLSVVILIGAGVALGAVDRLYRQQALSGLSRWRVGLPLAALAGWITVASAANISVALQDLGLATLASRQGQALLLLGVAGLVAITVLIREHAPAGYLATVAWALIALAVADATREHAPLVAGGACAWLAAAVVATLWTRYGHRSARKGFA